MPARLRPGRHDAEATTRTARGLSAAGGQVAAAARAPAAARAHDGGVPGADRPGGRPGVQPRRPHRRRLE
ncbi:MAG: hypothetical protein MZW92_07230 [Comamonadaceae bacterium]|nr:hypothetical protein [Comamonadaceae bacterium]